MKNSSTSPEHNKRGAAVRRKNLNLLNFFGGLEAISRMDLSAQDPKRDGLFSSLKYTKGVLKMIALVNEEVIVQPKQSRCHSIGIELEGFTERQTSKNLAQINGGYWEDDAGMNLCELITSPQESVATCFEVLRQLVECSADETHFVPWRPAIFAANKGKWHPHERYNALREALALESPNFANWVDEFTNAAALQINFSGDIEPFGEDGTFLINMFNATGPYIAHQVHKEIGQGTGHLSIWQHFARNERLPLCDRWFANAEVMTGYIRSTPKLLKINPDGSFAILPKEPQCIEDKLDLSVIWWLLRPKRGDNGPYLESRLLPSMPLEPAEKYALLTIEMVEAMLDWFHGDNGGHPVPSLHDSEPAWHYLHQRFPDYIPPRPLSSNVWHMCLEM